MRPPKVLKILTILTAFCLLLGMAASASADTLLAPGIYVNGEQVVLFDSGNITDKMYEYEGVYGKVTFDLDPGIIWSVNATNPNNAPMNVQVAFGPFATPGYPGPITFWSSQGGSVSDGYGVTDPLADGIWSVQPWNADFIAINYTYYLDGEGNPVLANAWGVGPGFFLNNLANKGHTVLMPTSEINAGFGAGGPNDFFLEVVSFTLSANDSTGLSGNCSFVPIPPTALLLGSGMLGMALLGWRRKRQS